MAKDRAAKIEADEVLDATDVAETGIAETADSAVRRGRALLEHGQSVAGNAREILADAHVRVEGMSDAGIIAASGFALGLTGGLLLAGAPRPILALSAIPTALMLRSAMLRGIRPARPVN